MDLVVLKCQERRVRRQFCRANVPRKDILSLAFLPPGSRKGTPENGDGQPEYPRPDVPPGSAEKRCAPYLTKQRGESKAKAKVYFCVPLCGAVTSRYTALWRFSFFSERLQRRASSFKIPGTVTCLTRVQRRHNLRRKTRHCSRNTSMSRKRRKVITTPLQVLEFSFFFGSESQPPLDLPNCDTASLRKEWCC